MKMKNITKMAIAGAFCAMILTGCELFNADKKAEITAYAPTSPYAAPRLRWRRLCG